MITNIKTDCGREIRPQLSEEIKELVRGTGYFVKPLVRGNFQLFHNGEKVAKPMPENQLRVYMKLVKKNKPSWDWQEAKPATQRIVFPEPEPQPVVSELVIEAPVQKAKRPRIKAVLATTQAPTIAYAKVGVPKKAQKPVTVIEKIRSFVSELNLKSGYKKEEKDGMLYFTVKIFQGRSRFFSAKIPTNGKEGEFKTSKAGKPTNNFAKWMAEVACCCRCL